MKKILNKGFTLIELMVVIVIIGILAALAIPKFTGASAKAKITEAPRIIASYETSELAYFEETGSASAAGSLAWTIPLSKWWGYVDAGGGVLTATPSQAFTANEWTTSVWLTTTVTAGSTTHTTGNDAVVKKYLPNFK